MQTMPHLHFRGNCREALNFYADTFGGKIVFAMTYGESPAAERTAPEARNQIIHARMEFGNQALLGCDAPPDRYQTPQGFNIVAGIEKSDEAERIFNKLAANGTIGMPFQQTFWAYRFGMCTDRFGTPWMINCEKAP